MTPTRPRTVPRDGLTNPTFDAMGEHQDLIISLSFLPGLTDGQLRALYRWVRTLETSPDRGDCGRSPFVGGEPFIHEHLFHTRLCNLRDPRGVALSLIDALTSDGVRVQDAFFACWEPGPDGVMGPRPDPRVPADAAPSERPDDLRGGILVLDKLVLEHRGSPLYFPEARVEYGLVPCERVISDQAVPLPERTDSVRLALIRAMSEGWATLFRAPGRGEVRPQPINAKGEIDQVDAVVANGRTGYQFSVDATTLLDRPSPGTCRMREYELMEAVLDAVTTVGLEPVVNWQRFGTPLLVPPIKQPDSVEIQIWEPTERSPERP